MNTMNEMVEAVKAHAIAHYNDGEGWDMVAECMGTEEITEALTNVGEYSEVPVADPTTNEEAIAEISKDAALWEEMKGNTASGEEY